MKNLLIKIALIVFYSVPYVFLAMNDDAVNGTMWFYGNMIIALALLTFISKKTHNKMIVVIGNICSFVTSFIFMFHFRTEKWEWYFKPLADTQLLIIVSVISFAIQSIFIFRKTKIQD